jgi:hypothetical protein
LSAAATPHSNVLIDLAKLAESESRTTITWVVRRPFADSKYGGEANDALPARGALGTRMRALVERGAVRQEVLRISELKTTVDGVHVSDGERELGPFDEIIATTGFRPDLATLRELRVRWTTSSRHHRRSRRSSIRTSTAAGPSRRTERASSRIPRRTSTSPG